MYSVEEDLSTNETHINTNLRIFVKKFQKKINFSKKNLEIMKRVVIFAMRFFSGVRNRELGNCND